MFVLCVVFCFCNIYINIDIIAIVAILFLNKTAYIDYFIRNIKRVVGWSLLNVEIRMSVSTKGVSHTNDLKRKSI